MPTAKPWDPEDVKVREYIAALVQERGMTVRALSQASEIGRSRVHSILTGGRAPATVGEIERLGRSLGVKGSVILREAEERVAADLADALAAVEEERPDASKTLAPVIEGRFGGLGVTADVPDRVAAQIGKRSISEEQETWE